MQILIERNCSRKQKRQKLPWQKKKMNDLSVTDHLVNIQDFEKADQQQILPATYNSLFLPYIISRKPKNSWIIVFYRTNIWLIQHGQPNATQQECTYSFTLVSVRHKLWRTNPFSLSIHNLSEVSLTSIQSP